VLKNVLTEICFQNKILFHPEDFDSGAHSLPNTIRMIKENTKSLWKAMAKVSEALCGATPMGTGAGGAAATADASKSN
jgi:hypothetical protein